MNRTYIDLETYSSRSLRDCGVYAYGESPDFCVLMAAYARDDSDVEVVLLDEETRASHYHAMDLLLEASQGRGDAELFDVWDRLTELHTGHPGTLRLLIADRSVLKVAHNAQFDRVLLSYALLDPDKRDVRGRRLFLDPARWDDTLARAAEHGYPRSLDALAADLGVTQKDSAGSALVRKFCKPISAGKRKGERRMPHEHPEDWARFILYCVQDVEALRAVDQAIPGWPTPGERELWIADQRINDRGIALDADLARAAVMAGERNAERFMAELRELTGLENPNSVVQLSGWLAEQGAQLLDLRAKTVQAALEYGQEPDVHRALELRQEMALSASKKFARALSVASSDDRVRGSLQFFGAHTGRWSGRGMQLQNLPRESFPTRDERDAAIFDLVELGADVSPRELKALVRPSILVRGCSVDLASIESRVLAWLAGEQWKLDAFAAGEDIYVRVAEAMSTPTTKLTRQQGKVAELACGYGGWSAALAAMGFDGTAEQAAKLARAWRQANPAIEAFWGALEDAFVHGGAAGDRLHVEADGDVRRIVLPSGRPLTYRGFKMVTRIRPSREPEDAPSFAKSERGGIRREDTYGGRLAENVTQAVARDVLAHAVVELERQQVQVTSLVHDEVLAEGDVLGRVERALTTVPPWAAGLPLAAEGAELERYEK